MDITWLEVTVEAGENRLEDLAARLTANGVTGLVLEDETDFLNFLEQNRQYWDYVDEELLARMKGAARVKFYVTDDADGQHQLSRWMAGIELPYTTAPLRENDWATSWQKYYRPMPVGNRLYIVPEWEREAPIPAGRTGLYLSPGLTFGTGSHASTRLCLEWVEGLRAPVDQVLDLGCGSGILSIAALLLGANQAMAVDIDPKAVDVAYENAALNGIGRDRYTVLSGDILTDTPLKARLSAQTYDLVLANIVADVIIPLSVHVKNLLSPGGIFLCSGIIDARAEEVTSALKKNGLTPVGRKDRDGWVSLAASI